MKKRMYSISMVILCLIALFINYYMDEYRAIGAFCIILIGILAIVKDNKNNCK